MILTETRVAYLVANEFEDLEFWVPLMRLKEEGVMITIAGPKAQETYHGKIGVPAISDISFDGLSADQFHGVVIPGGWAPDKIRRYPSVCKFLQDLNRQNKIIAMICHAGLVGISAGIVKGHDSTGSEGIKDDLINAGAIWKDSPAFQSGNLVWGRVVADIPAFCRVLISAFEQLESK